MRKKILKLLRTRQYAEFQIALALMKKEKYTHEQGVKILDTIWPVGKEYYHRGKPLKNFPEIAIYLGEYRKVTHYKFFHANRAYDWYINPSKYSSHKGYVETLGIKVISMGLK